jgi:hypothetical protein
MPRSRGVKLTIWSLFTGFQTNSYAFRRAFIKPGRPGRAAAAGVKHRLFNRLIGMGLWKVLIANFVWDRAKFL